MKIESNCLCPTTVQQQPNTHIFSCRTIPPLKEAAKIQKNVIRYQVFCNFAAKFYFMKKLYFFVLVSLSMIMVSCKDDSGDFIEQYYTNAELTSALRACLTTSKDTALNILCVADGFNANENYRIVLPDNAEFRALIETLAAQNKSELADTLVNQLNRACEQSGNTVSALFNSTISSLTFPDPSSLVYSSSTDAATSFFKTNCGTSLQNSTASTLTEQMQSTGASATWADIQSAYYSSTSTFFNYDIASYTATGFLNAIYTEMAKEEKRIRTDTTHASSSSLAVFRN